MLTFNLYENLAKIRKAKPTYCPHCMGKIMPNDLQEDGDHLKHIKCGRMLPNFVSNHGMRLQQPISNAFVSTVGESEADPEESLKKLAGLPEKADEGKAFIVLWADGRAIRAFKTKKAAEKFIKEQGTWAEVAWVHHEKPIHKGKALKVYA